MPTHRSDYFATLMDIIIIFIACLDDMMLQSFLFFLWTVLPWNAPNTADVLLNKSGEHRDTEFGPSSHSEPEQVAVRIRPELFDVLAIASTDGDDVRTSTMSETSDILHELVQVIALVDVEVEDCATVHLGVEIRSWLMSVVIQNSLQLNWLPWVKFVLIDVKVHQVVLS